jgi:hypothetical protein
VRDQEERALAVRASASVRASRWRRRPERRVWYDAWWPDGRVEVDASLSRAMYRRSPADFAAVEQAVHDHCPEEGQGSWVDDRGGVVEGPQGVVLDGARAPRGIRRSYGHRRRPLSEAQVRGWRLGGGTATLGLGVALVAGPVSDGPAGAAGVVCCLVGIAALTGLVRRRRR